VAGALLAQQGDHGFRDPQWAEQVVSI
jgi:hypothetical protein